MALDAAAPIRRERGRDPARPLVASLRWGLGWTLVVATLGATTGCVSATPVEAPAPTHESSPNSTSSYDERYQDCVDALGDMPDAAEHHIDACEAVAAAGAFPR